MSDPTNHPDLLSMFLATACRYPGRTALAVKSGEVFRPITYTDLAGRARRMGAGLAAAGVAPGDRVALISENRPEWAVADLGAYAAGAVVVPVYPTLSPSQVEEILADSGACLAVVSSPERATALLGARDRLPELQVVVTFAGPTPDGVLTFEGLVALGDDPWHRAECERRTAALTPEDLATIVYTSGTTGEVKGAMLTHGNLLANLEQIDRVLPVTETDRFLSFLPLSHIFERTCGHYLPLRHGAAIYYAESLMALARNMVEVRPTIMMSVPRLYENIRGRILDAVAKASPAQRRLFEWALAAGRAATECRLAGKPIPPLLTARRALADRLVLRGIRERTGGRVRFAVSGGAPLPRETAGFFLALGLRILQGYGLTETSPVISVNRVDDPRPEGVGPPIPGVAVRVAEDGEICSRGPHVMRGYWNRPADTAAALDGDGWFHTGDVGRLDADGHLHVTDRKKNLLVLSTGKKVAPQPIEVRLRESPYIAEAILVGDRRPTVGALLVPDFAALRARDGLASASEAELAGHPEVRRLLRAEVDRLTAGLADFERIKRFAILPRGLSIEAGEMTPTLKARREVICRHFASELAHVYGSEGVNG